MTAPTAATSAPTAAAQVELMKKRLENLKSGNPVEPIPKPGSRYVCMHGGSV